LDVLVDFFSFFLRRWLLQFQVKRKRDVDTMVGLSWGLIGGERSMWVKRVIEIVVFIVFSPKHICMHAVKRDYMNNDKRQIRWANTSIPKHE
jgi:hypothetical protein